VEEEPAQICESSPNPWNDLDQISLPSNDKAVIPSRRQHATALTTSTTHNTIALRRPGFVPAFLFSIHFSNSYRAHVRERAPPSLA
jgi:hypothetical protein